MRTTIFVALFASSVTGSADSVTPIQKVIEMLSGMLQEAKSSKHEEQTKFSAFNQFCDDVTTEKQGYIKEAIERVAILKADIQKNEADVERLLREIAEHNTDIETWQNDLKTATSDRQSERSDYMAKHQDLSESVAAIQEALTVMKKQAHDSPQAAALLQVVRSFAQAPASAKHAIDLFLAQDPEIESFSEPQANAYEFQSQGVVDVLKNLEDKFVDERNAIEREEVSSRQAFEVLSQEKHHEISVATSQIAQKKEAKSGNLQAIAQLQGDLQQTTTTQADDQAYLDDLIGSCHQKTSDFESRQELRSQEIESLEKAVEILSGDAVSGAAEKHLPTMMLQRRGHPSFSQLRSNKASETPNQLRAAAFLKDEGDRQGSRVLSMMATHAQDDTFAKVKKMISDLIKRLEAQADEEAEHKGWCDEELKTNEATRTTKTDKVELLRSEIDALQSSIDQLAQEISDLSQAIAELEAAVAKATAIRSDEKATNDATLVDAVEAQTAVAKAMAVLKDFYSTAAEATALVQDSTSSSRQTPPSVFEAPFKGQQLKNNNVVAFLEVIQSDFARLESDTREAETTAQQEYDQFMQDSEVDQTQKSKDIKHKSSEKETQEGNLVEKTQDLRTTQAELDSALAYYDKLKPSCLVESEGGVANSFSGRVQRRQEEIVSLQEALRILNGEDISSLSYESHKAITVARWDEAH